MVIWAAISFAQESVKPSYGVKTERPVAIALINGKKYYDVTVELSSAEITDMFVEGVKVTVKDEKGKKIYKKRFSKSRLYAFSDGTIQIGKGNAVTNLQRPWISELTVKKKKTPCGMKQNVLSILTRYMWIYQRNYMIQKFSCWIR